MYEYLKDGDSTTLDLDYAQLSLIADMANEKVRRLTELYGRPDVFVDKRRFESVHRSLTVARELALVANQKVFEFDAMLVNRKEEAIAVLKVDESSHG